jgi:hypothetical protein
MTETVDLYRALAEVAGATKACGAKWLVGGSASLLLRGMNLPAQPRDLDIYCDEPSIPALYGLLQAYAQDEPELSVTSMYRSTLCHFELHGVQVELVGGFEVEALGSRYVTAVEAVLWPHASEFPLPGGSVHVVPLAHELWFNQLRGREDRVSQIVAAMTADFSAHAHALAAIEGANSFDAAVSAALHERLRIPATEAAR